MPPASLRADWTLSQRDTFGGKVRRLRLFPLHTLTARFARHLHVLNTKRAQQVLKSRGHERFILSRDAEALQQDAADLVYLYNVVTRQRPSRCIEFGSGQSTIFIAQGLHDLGRGHLWSLDADPRWISNSKRSLPNHLQFFVTFVHSPAVIHREYGVPAFRYSIIPAGEWDFVLIDGPALTSEVQLSTDLIELRLASGAEGMVDHRWRSAALAKEVAGHRLKLRYMPLLESFSIVHA